MNLQKVHHIAIIGSSYEKTNEKGIKTEPIRLDVYTGKKMTFFYEPDNLPLEIHE